MTGSYIERQVERSLREALGEKAAGLMRGVSSLAAKQGGGSTLENYQLLGKRVLFVLGVAAVAAQAIGFVIARKSEEQRIERVVRRVLEEEREKVEAEA